MSILNLYIIKRFVRPFLASFAALCCLIFVSQIFDRLDRFLAEGVSLGHVIGFLITSLPFQALQILPVACLLATLFVVGSLARSREYIAGLAGGLAPEKFLSGLFWAGLTISLVALISNETFIPPATEYARTVFREKIRRLGEWQQSVFKNLVVAGSEGRLWTVQTMDESTGILTRVVVDTYRRDATPQMGPQIDAESAKWTKQGWVFKDGVVRTFKENNVTIDTVRKFDSEIFFFSEKPSDFVIQEPQPEEMNFKKLRRHIRHLEDLGVPVRPLEVELMTKLAFPFACFVVTFLGVPLALQSKGSHAMGIAAAGILTLFYLGFMQFGKAMAQRLIPPWAGAWLGNVVFIAIGTILWIRMRRSA